VTNNTTEKKTSKTSPYKMDQVVEDRANQIKANQTNITMKVMYPTNIAVYEIKNKIVARCKDAKEFEHKRKTISNDEEDYEINIMTFKIPQNQIKQMDRIMTFDKQDIRAYELGKEPSGKLLTKVELPVKFNQNLLTTAFLRQKTNRRINNFSEIHKFNSTLNDDSSICLMYTFKNEEDLKKAAAIKEPIQIGNAKIARQFTIIAATRGSQQKQKKTKTKRNRKKRRRKKRKRKGRNRTKS
jgi:hypothetical protein